MSAPPVPAVIVVEKRPPKNPQADPFGDVKTIGAVTLGGWDTIFPDVSHFSSHGYFIPDASPIKAEIPRILGAEIAGLRAHRPQYEDLSDQEFAGRLQENLLFVGGAGERLVDAFCSKSRLWFGWW